MAVHEEHVPDAVIDEEVIQDPLEMLYEPAARASNELEKSQEKGMTTLSG